LDLEKTLYSKHKVFESDNKQYIMSNVKYSQYQMPLYAPMDLLRLEEFQLVAPDGDGLIQYFGVYKHGKSLHFTDSYIINDLLCGPNVKLLPDWHKLVDEYVTPSSLISKIRTYMMEHKYHDSWIDLLLNDSNYIHLLHNKADEQLKIKDFMETKEQETVSNHIKSIGKYERNLMNSVVGNKKIKNEVEKHLNNYYMARKALYYQRRPHLALSKTDKDEEFINKFLHCELVKESRVTAMFNSQKPNLCKWCYKSRTVDFEKSAVVKNCDLVIGLINRKFDPITYSFGFNRSINIRPTMDPDIGDQRI
jgi:hypothetical protein